MEGPQTGVREGLPLGPEVRGPPLSHLRLAGAGSSKRAQLVMPAPPKLKCTPNLLSFAVKLTGKFV